jgi:hypothetical protein
MQNGPQSQASGALSQRRARVSDPNAQSLRAGCPPPPPGGACAEGALPIIDVTQAEAELIHIRLLAALHWPHDGPDDAEERLRFERSVAADHIIQEARRSVGAQKGTPGGKLDIGQILAAADEPRLAELLPGMKRPRQYARNAAFMLGSTLANQGGTLERAKKQIRHTFAGRGFSRATLERCWANYRSVSPLWLAYLLRPNPHRLPSSEAELADVFQLAEALQRQAAAYRTGKRGVSLVAEEELWRFHLPAHYEREPLEIIWFVP